MALNTDAEILKRAAAGAIIAVAKGKTLFQEHVKACPFYGKGRHYRDKKCPIYVDYYNEEGERITRSLRTNIWEEAEKCRDLPIEEIQLIPLLWRKHVKVCPFYEHGRARYSRYRLASDLTAHAECNCPIWVQERIQSKGGGHHFRLRSLGTHNMQRAERHVASFARGEPVQKIKYKIWRLHPKSCPFFKLGQHHTADCNCPIHIDHGFKDGKRIQRSLGIKDWDQAIEIVHAIERGSDLAVPADRSELISLLVAKKSFRHKQFVIDADLGMHQWIDWGRGKAHKDGGIVDRKIRETAALYMRLR